MPQDMTVQQLIDALQAVRDKQRLVSAYIVNTDFIVANAAQSREYCYGTLIVNDDQESDNAVLLDVTVDDHD